MTLPISIHVGELATVGHPASRRAIGFVAPRALGLGRLHVERAPRAIADQRAIFAVLSDLDQQLLDVDARDEDQIARLVAQRDDLVGQTIDREWCDARNSITVASIVVDDAPAMSGTPPRALWPSAVLGEVNRAERQVMPLSSGFPIQPNQTAQIVARPQIVAFRPERFFISGAGTPGGAADWVVQDIRIGTRSQLAQAGELPGEMFATGAIDAYVSFETAQISMDVTIIVRYVGTVEAGVPFFASMIGTTADGWDGLVVSAGARVRIEIENLGEEGDFRAVWLAEEVSASAVEDDDEDEVAPPRAPRAPREQMSAEQIRALTGAWRRIIDGA